MKLGKLNKIFNKFKRRFFVIHIHQIFKKKIKDRLIKEKCEELTKPQIKKAREYYSSRGINKIRTYWHQYYTHKNGIFSDRYIPEDYFHSTICYALNHKAYRSLMDKNLLDKIFVNVKHPKTVIKKINGFYQSDNKIISESEAIEICEENHNQLIIKPSVFSGGGKNILVFSSISENMDKKFSLINLFGKYGKNFIIQEVVSQHPKIKTLNESSLNTFRVVSYLNDKNVHILSTYIRVGGIGNFVDNVSSGGLACGVGKTGVLNNFGLNKKHEKIYTTPNGTKLEGFVIPHFDNIINKVLDLHKQVPYFRIIGWDMSLDEYNNAVLIEYNLWEQEIGGAQIISGPLFGDFTDEVLNISVKYNKVN